MDHTQHADAFLKWVRLKTPDVNPATSPPAVFTTSSITWIGVDPDTSPTAVFTASIAGTDVDPVTSPPAVPTASSIPGIDVDPALNGAAAIVTSHLQQTKPNKISVNFSNGLLRTYKRVSSARSAAVGERQARRRHKSVAPLMSSLAIVDQKDIGAVVTGILWRSRAQGGVSVAALTALSVQQQFQLKITNKVSGVTAGRFRAFTSDIRLASN